jgi:oxygen-independent coproporphyrinogen-3 oxidase
MYSYPHKTAYRPFHPPVSLAPYLKKAEGRQASLYFHIPFCRYKCGFCNLFSLQSCNKQLIDACLEAMRRQAVQLSLLTENLHFGAFAIGGGTPLLLSAGQLNALFDIAALFGGAAGSVPTSIETSPHYADADALRLLKEKGVQRLSLGVQSFCPDELRQIQRQTPVALVKKALDTVCQINFPRFNIDLIYGIEGQTVESFLYSLRSALSYRPAELFMYPLYIRDGVRISGQVNAKRLFDMYQAGRNELLQAGFKQTSMRRFVKNDAADPAYSCGDELMISCGCGGRSYIGDLHCATPYAAAQPEIKSILHRYIATTDFTVAGNGYLLTEEEIRRRYLIKNFLYYRGIDKADYERRFENHFPDEIFKALSNKGLAEDKEGFVRLTDQGMAYSDDIGALFISPAVQKLMDNYPLE